MIMKKMMIFILCITLYSCAPTYMYHPKRPLQTLSIGTENLVIEALDGSFKWEYGQNYNVPLDFPFFQWSSTNKSLAISTELFSKINEGNAKKVMVYTPYSDKPVYGYLQISKVHTPCIDEAPETRSYYVQVPESYYSASQGGKISVMYESYMCTSGKWSDGTSPSNKHGYSTWVLWLSDRPL
jgi:hypothetical protein